MLKSGTVSLEKRVRCRFTLVDVVLRLLFRRLSNDITLTSSPVFVGKSGPSVPFPTPRSGTGATPSFPPYRTEGTLTGRSVVGGLNTRRGGKTSTPFTLSLSTSGDGFQCVGHCFSPKFYFRQTESRDHVLEGDCD